MTAVPFLDMKAHVAAIRTEIDAAVARVLDSGWFILGPEGEAFERELADQMGAREAVAVANGTEAIQLALEALGIGPGDEVVTSPMTAALRRWPCSGQGRGRCSPTWIRKRSTSRPMRSSGC